MFNLKLAEETEDDGGYAPGKDGRLRTSIPNCWRSSNIVNPNQQEK